MIQIQNVNYRYGGCKENCLTDVTLTVPKGQCVLLTGSSGCGKTSIIRLINGLIPAFHEGDLKGTVEIAGKPVSEYKPEELSCLVGSVFQNPRSQFFNLDSTSEIAFGCENIGISRMEIQERISRTVKELNIERLLDRNIFELSNGEKQMLAIASAYAMEPDIFVMDEPSANLDTFAAEQLGKIIAYLKSVGKTIVIAEHRFHFLKGLPDRILHIENGKIQTEWSETEFAQMREEQRRSLGFRAYDLRDVFLDPNKKDIQKKPHLSISDLSVGYRRNHPVIHEIDLNASAGEIIGVIGKNGHGKTTFAKCLCGLIKESKGEIKLDTSPLSHKKRVNRFYLVMQDTNYQLFSDRVEGELSISMKKKGGFGSAERHAVLAMLRLDKYAERHPLSLSGGEKQRLTIATSMAQHSSVIILDEPTSGLDLENMLRVKEMLTDLRLRGKTIFVITHDYEFLLSTCTRIIHLEEGMVGEDYALNQDTLEKLQRFFLPGN